MPTHGPVVVDLDRSKYATRVVAGKHQWTVDEPGDLGGTDLGPGPFEQLLAAIGSCVVITVRMYADRKEWPLESVRAQVTHERRSPGDETIHLKLAFEGDLSEEQRARLEQIAGMCPVKRTVTGELTVETVLE